MKPNYVGILTAILSLLSLTLPWWTLTLTLIEGAHPSSTVSWYPWGYDVTGGVNLNASDLILHSVWAGWVAFALIMTGAVLGLEDSLLAPEHRRKSRLFGAGVANVTAVVVFLLGFSLVPHEGTFGSFSAIFYNNTIDNYNLYPLGDGPLGCGTLATCIVRVSIFSYLSVGYWLALASGILPLAATLAGRVGNRRIESSTDLSRSPTSNSRKNRLPHQPSS